jgi:hypothetical protein
MGRKLLAGILGGLAFFAWSGLAHMVLPLGETGVREIPNEQPVVAAMQSSIPERGLYIFPGTGLPANATRAEKGAAMEKSFQKSATGPSGLLMYHPARPVSFGQMLMTECATNIVQLLLAVFLLGQTSLAGFGARWGFITVAGILAAISTNVSYWNWYGFPGNYTLAYTFTIAVGFFVAGLVAAAIMKPGAGMRAARAAGA